MRGAFKLLKGDTDQILVFVGPWLVITNATSSINSEALVWFVLRHSCSVDCAVDLVIFPPQPL